MVLTKEQVEEIAFTARLELKEGEAEQFAIWLSAILENAAVLEQLDTRGVPPTIHPLDLVNVTRPDEEGGSLAQDEALANAPDKARGCFRVPRIID